MLGVFSSLRIACSIVCTQQTDEVSLSLSQVQRRMQAEIDREIGTRTVTMHDHSLLPYCCAVIQVLIQELCNIEISHNQTPRQ